MNLEQLVTQQWAVFLRTAIDTHRQKRPNDKRTDPELVAHFLKRLYKKGVIKKNEAGKYVLPRLVGGKLPKNAKDPI